MLQAAPTARVAGETGQVVVCEKSPGARLMATVTGLVLLLVTVTGTAELVVFTGRFPKSIAAGDTTTDGCEVSQNHIWNSPPRRPSPLRRSRPVRWLPEGSGVPKASPSRSRLGLPSAQIVFPFS